jgi:hypothetical protein
MDYGAWTVLESQNIYNKFGENQLNSSKLKARIMTISKF